MECGCELIVALISLPSAEVKVKERGIREGREEDQMAEKETLSPMVWFSCVFTSTHLLQTVTSGREFNLCGDESSLPASFFGASLLPSLINVLGLRRPSLCAMCLQNKNITSIFDRLGLLNHSWSLLQFGSYPEILQSGRFGATYFKPTFIKRTLNWLDDFPHVF